MEAKIDKNTSDKQSINEKNDNAEAGEMPSYWKSPAKCVINIRVFGVVQELHTAYRRRWTFGTPART